MKKKSRVFICSSCGSQFSRWAGKCSHCNEWNTIEEKSQSERFMVKKTTGKSHYQPPRSISEVEQTDLLRIPSGFSELDIVLGGGIVPGCLAIIGGQPGVGKSTLILELCRHLCHQFKVLYVSGEESGPQISLRAKRMDIISDNILLSSETYAENIRDMVVDLKPGIVFIDSIQTVTRESLESQAGSVSQLRECTQVFLELAKQNNIPIFLIGHITKEGNIAGPKVLEHLVDTVLYFEGDRLNYYRMLRAVKNRFGAVGNIAIFEMRANGLTEIRDRHHIFTNQNRKQTTGSVISAVMEGNRALSVEVQALVNRASYAQARRMAEGLDTGRLILLSAVIEKFLHIKLTECDIFTNLAGGLNIDEPALDLAICMAILSSYLEKQPTAGNAFIGEIGLSGEIRPISQAGLRVKELEGLGSQKIYLPERNCQELEGEGFSVILQGIETIHQLYALLEESVSEDTDF